MSWEKLLEKIQIETKTQPTTTAREQNVKYDELDQFIATALLKFAKPTNEALVISIPIDMKVFEQEFLRQGFTQGILNAIRKSYQRFGGRVKTGHRIEKVQKIINNKNSNIKINNIYVRTNKKANKITFEIEYVYPQKQQTNNKTQNQQKQQQIKK